ncbi:hypothetical protein C900_05171 [Fulvivirga imtechensis AK7]|uniref:Uncharacterized protein n=1 Tax=Fulvivirga imtechensis AK7 TaxID=1237149 RepID=L8JPJ7_9BACT|nr:hypothetical protein C900_05171 [Fulvivirga imtechensis AK7]
MGYLKLAMITEFIDYFHPLFSLYCVIAKAGYFGSNGAKINFGWFVPL